MINLVTNEPHEQLQISVGTLTVSLSVHQASGLAAVTLLISVLQRLLDPFHKNTRPRVQRLVTWVQMICFVCHVCIAANIIPANQNAFGRTVYPMRYVDWNLVYPLMLRAVQESADTSSNLDFAIKEKQMNIQTTCLFLGSIASSLIPKELKWLAILMLCCGYGVVYHPSVNLIRTFQSLQRLRDRSQARTSIGIVELEKMERAWILQAVLVVECILYFFVHFLGISHLITSVVENISFCIVDVLSKTLFAAVISYNDSFYGTEARRVRESQAARNQFLRYIFHEMRVPLNSLSLGIDVLKRDMQDSDDYSDFQEVLNYLLMW
jgi:bacteriorhodopsin